MAFALKQAVATKAAATRVSTLAHEGAELEAFTDQQAQQTLALLRMRKIRSRSGSIAAATPS
jgi:hypothetical protein